MSPIINCDATTCWRQALGCARDALSEAASAARAAGLTPDRQPDAFAAVVAAFMRAAASDYHDAMLGMVADRMADALTGIGVTVAVEGGNG